MFDVTPCPTCRGVDDGFCPTCNPAPPRAADQVREVLRQIAGDVNASVMDAMTRQGTLEQGSR